MQLHKQPYLLNLHQLPQNGRHIVGQYDDDTIVIYQAYKPSIANFALENQMFGGDFSLDRMSWIKSSFMWMMYRSGWGTKPNQERTLAIWLKRSALESALRQAVLTQFVPDLYSNRNSWANAVSTSFCLVQWDPDHDPYGARLERKAIQIGLRGEMLQHFAMDWIVEIKDISDFVAEQRTLVNTNNFGELETPTESVYPIQSYNLMQRLLIEG